ncbi:MAG: hypothetical protein ACWGSQ_18690 [Longimicrobiales bacterium]
MTGFGRVSVGGAGLILAAAMAVFGVTLTEAIRVEAPDGAPDGPTAPGSVAGEHEAGAVREPGGPYPRITETELLDAVNQDLFQPSRLPPPLQYRLPRERMSGPVVQQDPRRRRGPELRVVGAAVMGDRALALIQVDDSVPFAVLLGESVEGYTLAAVDQESATLTSPTDNLTLPVMEPIGAGRALVEPAQIEIDARNIEQFRSRMQEALRRQMSGRGGGGQP